MTGTRWIFPSQPHEEAAASLARSLRLQMPVSRILARRGFTEPEAALRFLRPALSDLHDPFLLLGMRAAAERLVRAVRNREPVLLYGDYDVDGTTSVVLLKTAIELAGGCASYHVPHRLQEGYGMRVEIVEEAAAQGVRLIISVDTGIREAQVVERAGELGIDVIVTDHHLPEETLPPALAVINPNQPGCGYPDKGLCGVGVAFKLVQALLASLAWDAARIERLSTSFLKLAAIGTVADLVPLSGENRALVKFGLAGLRDVRNAGLRALLDVAGIEAGAAPTATQVAFRIAPRINAAGRMASARDVVELFTTSDDAQAREIAARLNELNAERQATEAAIVDEILEACTGTPVTDTQAGLVFCGEGWHKGVVGIVASRLVERFHRPVFVLGIDLENGQASGSGRSIPVFHLLESLESMKDLFTKFGGHRQAAGVTLQPERVAEFRERFAAACGRLLCADDFVPCLEVDANVNLGELDDRSVGEVLSLAPFGLGNPNPVLAARGVELATEPQVFKERHVRAVFRQDRRHLPVKAWNFVERLPELQPGGSYDIAFTVEDDAYSAARGYPPWAATLREVRPAAARAVQYG